MTGLGVCTPLGFGVDVLWKQLLGGQCGVKRVPLDRLGGLKDIPCQVGGLIPPGEYNADDCVSASEQRVMSTESIFVLGVAKAALKDACWMPEDRIEGDSERTGISLGTGGTSSIVDYLEVNELLMNGKYRRISPYLIPKLLPNMPAGNASIKFQLKGPNHFVSTACSSGLHSIGDAYHMIARGASDVMVAGSADFSINPLVYAGFSRANALTTKFNDEPLKASRPFDSRRSGFVPSEGLGVVILEDLQHAKHRKANIYAEILGYGMSSDAYHITAPPPNGEGAARAMREAMRDAGVEPHNVGHVNAHATSTPLGDLAENRAIKQVFRNSDSELSVYAPKGALGHLLGAAGSVEAIIAILSVKEGLIPPNLNLEEKTSEFDLHYVTSKPFKWSERGMQRRIALTNSYGFGGTNASICIGEYIGP